MKPTTHWMVAMVLAGVALAQPAVAATNVLRMAVLWPKGSKWMTDMQTSGREIARKSDGRVQLKFVEQDDLDVGDSRCDGAMLAGPRLARYSQDCLVYALPLLFRSDAEADYVRKVVDPVITAALRTQHLSVLGVESAGFAYLHSMQPVDTVEKLQAAKLWVPPEEPELLALAKQYGITLVPLELNKVREGLEQGVVDTVITPPVGAIVMQWHADLKCVMDAPFMYVYVVIVWRQEAFDKLSLADRALLQEVLGPVFAAAFRETRLKEAEALDVLAQNGVARHKLAATPEQQAAWSAWASAVADRLVNAGSLSSNVLTTVRARLAEFRRQKP